MEDVGDSAKSAAQGAEDATFNAIHRGTEAVKSAGDSIVSGIQDIGDSAASAVERLRSRLEAAQHDMQPENRVEAYISAGLIPSNTEVMSLDVHHKYVLSMVCNQFDNSSFFQTPLPVLARSDFLKSPRISTPDEGRTERHTAQSDSGLE